MTFREATTADIPSLIEIRLSVDENILSDPNRITAEIYDDYLTGRGKGWVCEVDGQIVGFSVASLADASIWALFVKPGNESMGIGQTLLDLAVRWLFESGADKIDLTTEPDTRAARFYERRGWTKCGTTPTGETRFRLTEPNALR